MTVRNPYDPARYMDLGIYLEGTRREKLLLQYCSETGKYQYYPRPISIFSGRRQWKWQEASGRGRLVSWTTTELRAESDTQPQVRTYALVDLEEGVRMLSWLESDVNPQELQV